jgi:glutamate-1-semialdehyde 2,1-aminomutase/spore coat polysaccharide biosynthesis protein SpsF
MEPITVNGPMSQPSGSTKWKDYNKKNNFLRDVKNLCKKNGALLVFDEVVTGFRYDIGGAQKMFDVIPDLSCWAKAMSNGIPVSAITGRWEYIKYLEKTFFSFTYGGDCIGLAAAKATITKIEKKNVIDHLYKVGGRLKKGMNELAKIFDLEDMIACAGYPCRTVMTIKKIGKYQKPLITKSLIQQELMFRGVLWSQYHSICFSHKEKHIDYSLNAFEDAFKKLRSIIRNNKKIENYLLGKPCETVFTRVADFQAVATSQKN